jgi:hypothetical protein
VVEVVLGDIGWSVMPPGGGGGEEEKKDVGRAINTTPKSEMREVY